VSQIGANSIAIERVYCYLLDTLHAPALALSVMVRSSSSSSLSSWN